MNTGQKPNSSWWKARLSHINQFHIFRQKVGRRERKVLLNLAVHLEYRMCSFYHASAWKSSEISNLNSVDQISALNSYVMLISPLQYNWNYALGIRVSVFFITMKESLSYSLLMHWNIHFFKFEGEYTITLQVCSILCMFASIDRDMV